MRLTEHIERLLEIAVVGQGPPIAGQQRLVAGMRDRGLFEHGDGLRALPRGSQRLAVLQGCVGIVGIGAKALAIAIEIIPGRGGLAFFRGVAQRPRDIGGRGGLAAAKPQRQDRRPCHGCK